MAENIDDTQIVEIAIDDLGIDDFNLRKTPWNHNEDFIGSIKKNGIEMPLLVRPADPSTGVKYSIVHGSRRYNAAIDVGLETVPCKIRRMSNLEAAIASFDENFNRDPLPNWQYALQIGIIGDFLEGSYAEKLKMLKQHTGLSETTIDKYLAVSRLPEEVVELLKKPEERSTESAEILKKHNVDVSKKTLSLEKAALISKELHGFPISKQLEVASYVTRVSMKNVEEIIKRVKVYPKMEMNEIEKKVQFIPRGRNINIFFAAHIYQALDEAAIKMNRDIKTLIVYFTEKELERRGFLR